MSESASVDDADDNEEEDDVDDDDLHTRPRPSVTRTLLLTDVYLLFIAAYLFVHAARRRRRGRRFWHHSSTLCPTFTAHILYIDYTGLQHSTPPPPSPSSKRAAGRVIAY